MSDPINRPVGGIYGKLAGLGVEVTNGGLVPDNSTWVFGADVTFNGAVNLDNTAIGSGETLTIGDSGTLRLDGAAAIEVETGAVTLSSNAGTLSQLAGKITSEALSTAAGAAQALTITNTLVAATDIILVTRNGGSSDEGTPTWTVTPGAGSFVILLENKHASAALDGTFIFGFLVIKQAT